MSGVTLRDAEQGFAAALQDLRQDSLAAFELWLNGALATGAAAPEAIAGQIAASRRKLADAFISGKAAAIAEALNAGTGAHVARQLVAFATLGELPLLADASAPRPAGRWSTALRTALGAALGAAASLLVLSAVATHGTRVRPAVATNLPPAVPAQAPATTAGDRAGPTPNTAAPSASTPSGLTPSAPASPAADAAHPSPAPTAKPQPPAPSRNRARNDKLAVIIGAFGAAIGAFAAAMPARRRSSQAKGGARRDPTGGIAIAALALGAAGLAGLWLAGPAPWWSALLAIAAALAVWLVRTRWPGDAPATASGQPAAVAALERQLHVDCAIWSAVASGLVLGGEAGDHPAQALDQVRAVILTHRARSVAGEEILRVVEQELDLPIGPRDLARDGTVPTGSDFNWSPQHAKEFDTFGIIEPGDLVRVKIPPQTVVENGITRIVQKGVVVRKS